MIIDAHHHVWTADYAWLDAAGLERIRRDYTMDDLRPHLSAAGVDGTVLVEAGRCDVDETASLLALARSTPEIRGVVGWMPIADPRLAYQLAAVGELAGGELLVGVRDQLQGQADPDYPNLPQVRSGMAAAGAAGLVFDLVVRSDQLAASAEAVAAVPGTTFVLDHLGKPEITVAGLRDWRAAVGPLAARPNVVAKLSGLTTEAGPHWTPERIRPFVEAALELFGPQRLMAGSDWPVCELYATYHSAWSVVADCLAPHERAQVLGGTAARIYRLAVA